MCSRFDMSAEPRDIRSRFQLLLDPPLKRRGDMRPTNEIVCISDGGERADLHPWGFPAPWDGKPLINARAETLDEKKTFMPHLDRRCLVPATGYYEWRSEGRSKLKNLITLPGRGLFAFAGLLNETGEVTIITTKPAPSVAHIHGRMPVILPRETEAQWLDPQLPFPAVKALLRPFDNLPLDSHEDIPEQYQPDLFS